MIRAENCKYVRMEEKASCKMGHLAETVKMGFRRSISLVLALRLLP